PLRGIASPWGLGPSPPPFGLGPVRMPSVPWCGIGLPVRLGLAGDHINNVAGICYARHGLLAQRGSAHDIPPDTQPRVPGSAPRVNPPWTPFQLTVYNRCQ